MNSANSPDFAELFCKNKILYSNILPLPYMTELDVTSVKGKHQKGSLN